MDLRGPAPFDSCFNCNEGLFRRPIEYPNGRCREVPVHLCDVPRRFSCETSPVRCVSELSKTSYEPLVRSGFVHWIRRSSCGNSLFARGYVLSSRPLSCTVELGCLGNFFSLTIRVRTVVVSVTVVCVCRATNFVAGVALFSRTACFFA